MRKFSAPSCEVETPDDWQDASTYIVRGPKVMGFQSTVVVAFTKSVLDPYLKRHVDLQVQDLQKQLPGFALLRRTEPTPMPYGEAIILEFQWISREAGMPLHQYQMYAMAGTTLYTLTATAPVPQWNDLQLQLAGIIRSFRPKDWEAPTQAPV